MDQPPKRQYGLVVGLLASVCLTQAALAESESESESESTTAQWSAEAQAGLIMSTGNAQATSISAGAKGAHRVGRNKIAINVAASYARTSIFVANDADSDGDIDATEYERLSRTAARSLEAQARYDRFLNQRGSLYLAALAFTNEPAGKKFVGGAQGGYSRTILNSLVHTIVIEAGYDLSFEKPVQGSVFSNHGLRGFLGYEGKLSQDSSLAASLESLVNLNELQTPAGSVDRFEDSRAISKLSITTKVYGGMHLRFGFEARYDSQPSLLPAFETRFEADFRPEALKLDTKTEALLILRFL